MKPDWDEAPEWARWFAVDANGEAWWFEYKPEPLSFAWDCDEGRSARADAERDDWRDLLYSREDNQ